MKPESILKGKLARDLVLELLLKAGYKVLRLNEKEKILELLNPESEARKKISSIPDFLVFFPKKEPLFLEVKFRTDPEALEEELLLERNLEEFWRAKIILVTSREKPYFRVLSPPYFKKEKREGWPIPIFNWKSLENDNLLKIEKKILEEFEKLVEKFYL